jgi:hypothetical protein
MIDDEIVSAPVIHMPIKNGILAIRSDDSERAQEIKRKLSEMVR